MLGSLLFKFFEVGEFETLFLGVDLLEQALDLRLVVILQLFANLLNLLSKLGRCGLKLGFLLDVDRSNLCLSSTPFDVLIHGVG